MEGKGSGKNLYIDALALKDFPVNADREVHRAFNVRGGAAVHGENVVKFRVSDVLSGFIYADDFRKAGEPDLSYGAEINKSVVKLGVGNGVVSAAVNLSVSKDKEHKSSVDFFASVKGDAHRVSAFLEREGGNGHRR